MTSKKICLGFILAICIAKVSSVPLKSTTEGSVITTLSSSTSPTPTNDQKEVAHKGVEGDVLALPKIYGLKVNTNVTNRFATTLVTSKVKNLAQSAQEATFSVILPESAYISDFIMEVDGKSYKAYVKEKAEAKKIYDQAVSSGVAAAHVEANVRDSNRFTVSVNIEPQSKATFYLTYEELLQRQNGQYDIVINIHPGQPVKELDVQVNINETRPLKFVKAPPLRSGNEISKSEEKLDPKAEIEIFNATSAKVKFNPDIARQMELAQSLATKEDDGLAGQFIVQYDVERDPKGGEILVSDGYFVHFFAPSELTPLKKHVVFVLDTSGSMYGNRIVQLKEAMKSILGQLNKGDTFNIVDFDSTVRVWDVPNEIVQYQEGEDFIPYYISTTEAVVKQDKTKQTLPDAFEVNDKNIEQAQKVVEKLNADGGTDIDSALKVGLQLTNKMNATQVKSNQPIIIFLTDGEATSGEVDNNRILSKISENNVRQVPIFALSFGDGADRTFLEKVSLRNHGFARHIYEAADSALQLQAFYKYISSPLLSNVHFNYVSKAISKVTKTDFPILFDGAEFAVCGVWDGDASLSPFDSGFVTAVGNSGTVDLKPVIENSVGSLEKHWAYLTVKQVLEDRDAADNKTEFTAKALEIALKYGFVTPVSSLVVVKPNDTKAETETQDASKQSFSYSPSLLSGAGGSSISLASPGLIAAFAAPPQYYAESQDVQEELIIPISSTFSPTTGTASSKHSSSTTSDDLSVLKNRLPWLQENLSENGTLQLPAGLFKLGADATVTVHPECSQTPLNTTGTCTLLKDCEQVYIHLVDFQVYTKYFCSLNEFAGVCCPKKDN